MILAGKLALVTGAGRGIGLACARALAGLGATVVVTGRNEAALAAVATELRGHAVVADLADRTATDRMLAEVEAIGRVDVLVNNAGVAESRSLAATDDAMWDRIMEVDATAPFRITRALAPAMALAGWGRVITIASNAGLTGYGYSAAYCAAKHAVVGFTRALAVDLARTGVTINAVCPGWVETDLASDAVARIQRTTGRTPEASREVLVGMTPQRRMLDVAEVAHAVAMLCDHNARGIHGQTIVIDGGQVMK